ncbi:energy transducer TonB [Gemmatirosa kalamazoonensis]|uniref:energy transducer TonB n=1 Tax=Gemmatirosa kalamazoonensis TaxID=861299 RepID=UPI00046C98CC|nr:energy transducer TonB [Gemmatirosa kalamazoonensis]
MACVTASAAACLGACGGGEHAVLRDGTALPPARLANAADLAEGTVPRMLNVEPPFRYPTELYARKVQGDVTLRLHVDSTGRVRPESTSVIASSGYAALDSAAVRGAAALRFAPAVRDGRPVGRSIRFPVLFRHPTAPPLPTDTSLKRF